MIGPNKQGQVTASPCLMKLMICSSVNLLFLMPVILVIDGLLCL